MGAKLVTYNIRVSASHGYILFILVLLSLVQKSLVRHAVRIFQLLVLNYSELCQCVLVVLNFFSHKKCSWFYKFQSVFYKVLLVN